MRFAADLSHVPTCRRWAVDLARREGANDHSQRLVALLTTEATTNAVRHGPPGGEVRVDFTRRGDHLRVAVHDASPSEPVVRHVEPSSPGGRGVMLIDALSADWGVERESDGTKTVWFEVPVSAVALGHER